MFNACITSILLFIVFQYAIVVNTQCPSNSLIEPCLCIEKSSSSNQVAYYTVVINGIYTEIRGTSIVCANIQSSSFDLRSIFTRLSNLRSRNNQTRYNQFLLYNTQIKYLPKNLFRSVTFSHIMLYNNPLLNSIDIDAFDNTRNYVEQFQTMNTNLSDSDTLFTIIKQFNNLESFSMADDKIKSIPDYAFNNPELRDISLGRRSYPTSAQLPLIHIGDYPFYNVPNLSSLTISSPFLTKIGKYSLALNVQSTSALRIEINGLMLTGSSFEPTSLTRFRGRSVYLNFQNTSIEYLDEKIFQPFLATHQSSSIYLYESKISRTCDYRSSWVKDEYCPSRIYGTACCSFINN